MKCFDHWCEMPASGAGAGIFICAHEHVTAQGDFCEACWENRTAARHTWNCWRCYGSKPDGSREDWGHMCPMRMFVPD